MSCWKRLQAGESVRMDHRRIDPSEVFGKERKGITFVYCTDTRPCDTLIKYCANADMLMLEGMYGDPEKKTQAHKNHHMMMSEAAEIALQSGTAALYLTHYSTSVEDPNLYLEDTRKIFENTYLSTDGMKGYMRYPKDQEAAWTSLY